MKAMAKINLGLDVVGKRPDGYHDLRMLMQTVRLFDRIRISTTRTGGIRLKSNLGFLPTDDSNLAVKAARLLMEEFGVHDGVFIDLKKYIPVAAGLAGGSTDAAAVLVGLNILFDLGLSGEELRLRGARIGADVPYCVMRGTALAEGVGDILTPLSPIPDCSVLIAKPDIRVSTKYVYTHLQLDENTVHPDIDGQVSAILRKDLRGLCGKCGNVLETVTVPAHPEIQRLKDVMREHGALASMMSGSGPTVFGIFEDTATAQKAYAAVMAGSLAKQVFLTVPFWPHPGKN